MWNWIWNSQEILHHKVNKMQKNRKQNRRKTRKSKKFWTIAEPKQQNEIESEVKSHLY